jgi:hypothetical protein
MIDKDHHFMLKDAARPFLEDPGFSHVQVEDVMSSVFGLQRDGDDAMKWSQYWTALTVYEENLRDGNAGWAPGVRQIICSSFS